MYRYQRIFKLIVISILVLNACKSEPKKNDNTVIEKFEGIVTRVGDKLVISDCNSYRFLRLPISAGDSLRASMYATVSFSTDTTTGEKTIMNLSPVTNSAELSCNRDLKHIAQLHQNGRVVAVGNNQSLKLTIEKDRIEVQLASGEVIPFNYIDEGRVQDKYVLMSSTLSEDFQSDLRIIVSTYPVTEQSETLNFHCIIELNRERIEGIYNF